MEKSALQEFLKDYNNFKVKPQTYYLELEKKQLIDLSKHLRKYYEPITQNNYEWKNIRENKIYHIDEIINELHKQI